MSSICGIPTQLHIMHLGKRGLRIWRYLYLFSRVELNGINDFSLYSFSVFKPFTSHNSTFDTKTCQIFFIIKITRGYLTCFWCLIQLSNSFYTKFLNLVKPYIITELARINITSQLNSNPNLYRLIINLNHNPATPHFQLRLPSYHI